MLEAKTVRHVERVIFTYDFTRFGEGVYRHTALWMGETLFHMLRVPVGLGTGLPLNSFTTITRPECRDEFYRKQGLDGAKYERDWALVYHADPTPDLLVYIQEEFENALVMGFELPRILKTAFDRLQIPYIDVIIHPLRFLPDMCVGLLSNVPELGVFFRAQAIPRDVFLAAAAQQQARYAANIHNYPLDGPVLMLIGQHAEDKVLVASGGGFHSLMDFRDRILSLARGYKHVYFRRHPLHALPAATTAFLQEIPGLILLPDPSFPDLNMYMYLAHPAITGFAGLNSSVLLEAACFGKESVNFLDYEFDFGAEEEDRDKDHVWPVGGECFQKMFWKIILDVLCGGEVTEYLPMGGSLPVPNLRLIWRGAGSFDDAQSYSQCLKIAALEKRCDEFLNQRIGAPENNP